MTRRTTIQHQFVDTVPDALQEGVVYVCIPYTTAVHRCLCGCGEEVVTPIRPTGWSLTFDGVTVSLHPSIGNWDFPCRSHYWITHNRVRWDRQWTPAEVATGRRREDAHRTQYFGAAPPIPTHSNLTTDTPERRAAAASRVPQWLRPSNWLHRGRRRNKSSAI
jgi:hypothetical protein